MHRERHVTGGGKWDSEDKAEEAEVAEVEEQAE